MIRGLSYWIMIAILFFAVGSRQKAMSQKTADIRAGFNNPGGTARPKVYYWWLNGYTDTVKIKEELQAIKDAGIGGVDIFEIGFKPDGGMPAGPAFMGDSSLQNIVFAIKEAGKLGLEVGLNLASSWNAGGSWVKPEHAAKSLYQSKITVKGPLKMPVRIAFPQLPSTDKQGKKAAIVWKENGKPVYSKEIAALAFKKEPGRKTIDTSNLVNLNALLDPETDMLHWEVPDGEWEIHRYVCSNSGEQLLMPSPGSAGPIIDHFDAAATRAHFEYFINRLRPLTGDFKTSALKNLYLASFEAKAAVWSGLMGEEFRSKHGYGLEKMLPAIFDATLYDAGVYQRFSKDLKRTMSDMMIRNHYGKGKEIANQYGLQLISESGGPYHHNIPVEALKALGTLDVPRGEFWINQERYGETTDSIDLLFLVKQIAAASNTYQRKITELEAFTSYQNWMEAPVDMKPVGDRAFAEGMNRAVIHGFAHNPGDFGSPGIAYYAGTHYNNKVTWWPRVKPFNDYLSRISYIFQQTPFYADVLFYYGNRVPNYTTPKNSRFAAGDGYDYEIINTEKLITELSVKDGLLTLPYGAAFKVLALGEIDNPEPALIAKLRSLAAAGAVIVGPRPKNADHTATNDLWAARYNGSFERGKIYDLPVMEALKYKKTIPDFDYADKGSSRLDYQKPDQRVLDYIHYSSAVQDFYFVRNTGDRWLSRLCSFRQQDRPAEIWHPVDGTSSPVLIAKQENGVTKIPLTFAPYESYFVVFNKNTQPASYTEVISGNHPPLLRFTPNGIEWLENGRVELVKRNGSTTLDVQNKTIQLQHPWNLSFDTAWGGPENLSLDQLVSWTVIKDNGVKYYSGKVDYLTHFDFDITAAASHAVYLDLGKVSRLATVWLNGKPAGTSWCMPYRLDITDLVQAGSNELRVEVINTWSNRIIGDKLTGTHYTRTNLADYGYRDVLNTKQIPWAETPLLPSGLLGPVTIQLAARSR